MFWMASPCPTLLFHDDDDIQLRTLRGWYVRGCFATVRPAGRRLAAVDVSLRMNLCIHP